MCAWCADNGFDDLDTIKLANDEDLRSVGIVKTGHRKKILAWTKEHPVTGKSWKATTIY